MPIFPTFDGLSLHFEIVGEGSPVVLLHGFASSYEVNWRRPGVVRVLLEAGHQVIGLNARGHEGSDAPHDPRAYSNGAMVNDVVALFDHLSLSQSDVVGYSMGALTAFAFAQRDRRVRRLVLGGIGGYAERLESVQDDSVWAERSKRIADALETDDPSSIGDIRARGFRRFADWRKSDRYALAAIQRSGSLILLPGDPSAVSPRTLVICGDKDDAPEPLAAMLPNAESKVVKGTHLSAVFDPAFAQEISRFLA